MNVKLDHINLTVRDISESMAWYENLFGFEFVEGDLNDPKEPWAIVGKDETFMAIYEVKNLKPANEMEEGLVHRVYHFGLRVSDKTEWEALIKKHEIKVLYGGAHKYPNSLSWYIFDPSGHEIEVSYFG